VDGPQEKWKQTRILCDLPVLCHPLRLSHAETASPLGAIAGRDDSYRWLGRKITGFARR